MSGSAVGVNDVAGALRAEFDRSFEQAPSPGTAVEDLLAIELGGDPYALRLAQVSALVVDKTVVELPTPVAELRGIAGFRGSVLPVYDLGMLMGKPRSTAPRWLIVAAAMPVALAVEGFSGFLRVRADAVIPETREGGARHIREIVQGGIARPIVHVPSVLETVAKLCGPARRS